MFSAAKGLRIGTGWTEDCAEQLEGHLLLHSVGSVGCRGGRQRGINSLPVGNKPPSPQVQLLKSVYCAHVKTDVTCSFPARWVQARALHM